MTEGKQHIARGPAGGRSLGLLHLDGQPHLCNQNSILLTVRVLIPSTACRKQIFIFFLLPCDKPLCLEDPVIVCMNSHQH